MFQCEPKRSEHRYIVLWCFKARYCCVTLKPTERITDRLIGELKESFLFVCLFCWCKMIGILTCSEVKVHVIAADGVQ